MRTLALAIPLVISLSASLLAGQDTRPPARSEAYYEFLLGRYLEGEGNIEDAIAAHERARQLDPGSAEPTAELAGLYARQGQFDRARALAETALTVDAANIEAHRVLGSVFAALADHDARDASVTPADAARRAIDHLEKSRRRDGVVDPGIELTLARLYLNGERPEDAARVLRRLLNDEVLYRALTADDETFLVPGGFALIVDGEVVGGVGVSGGLHADDAKVARATMERFASLVAGAPG